MSITCGIDVGTQSTKVIVYDSEIKKIIATSSSSYELITKDDGTREQIAEWFIDAIKNCFNSIPEEIKKKIEGIGVSGQQHGFVALDEEGKPIVPVKLWCDTSTSEQCVELTKKLGGYDKVFDLIQNQIKPGYTVSKILYLKEKNPKAYEKLAHILLPHDWVNYYLTNSFTMERGDASGTAFFNVKEGKWSKEVLSALDENRNLEKLLPKLIRHNEIAGRITEKVSKELGIKSGIPVSCGGGDNMMGAIGAGCTTPGSMVMSMGTSGTLFGYSDNVIADKEDRLACFASSSGGFLPLLCTMNCTVVSEKFRELLNLDVKEFDELASKSKPGCNGLITLPYFNGERTPNYPKGEGVLAGMNLNNLTRENFARSALESAIFGMKTGLEAFKEQGFKIERIILIGGGAKSKVWPQMVADIFQIKVGIPEIRECAAFGGALQVLALIENKNMSQITNEHVQFSKNDKFLPEKSLKEVYEKTYLKFKNYDSHLSELFQ